VRLVIPSTAGESKEFADWLARQHGNDEWRATGQFFGYGVKDDDEIIAAVILEPFHADGSVLASISIDSPDVLKNRQLVKNTLAVPFSELFNASRVSLIIEDSYTRVIRVAEILGFKQEGTLPKQFGENSGVLLGMTKNPLGLVA